MDEIRDTHSCIVCRALTVCLILPCQHTLCGICLNSQAFKATKWIVQYAGEGVLPNDVVLTAEHPLAHRVLLKCPYKCTHGEFFYDMTQHISTNSAIQAPVMSFLAAKQSMTQLETLQIQNKPNEENDDDIPYHPSTKLCNYCGENVVENSTTMIPTKIAEHYASHCTGSFLPCIFEDCSGSIHKPRSEKTTNNEITALGSWLQQLNTYFAMHSNTCTHLHPCPANCGQVIFY